MTIGAASGGLVLTLNAGSSSLKFALFEAEDAGAAVARGQVSGLGTAEPRIAFPNAASEPVAADTHADAMAIILDHMGRRADLRPIRAVGHRVVHGGPDHAEPCRIDASLLETLAALTPLAPLHLPGNIDAILAARAAMPAVPHVACFDTAFHRTIPPIRQRFGLPRALHDQGILRYGFHGLSYQHVAGTLLGNDPRLAGGRVIAAHLGNGASLCALAAGVSVETSMGLTALDGLMMGTRCGSLDPGVVLHLLHAHGMEADAVETLLNHRSGLLGVSGLSPDMRVLLASREPAAREAVALFAWRAAREAGAMMVALGGLDGLVFTGGIGEHAWQVRQEIADHLASAGVRLDPGANTANLPVISSAESAVVVRIIPADEEQVIAHATRTVAGLT